MSHRPAGPEPFRGRRTDQGVDALCLDHGRIKTDGPEDYDAVHKVQAGLKMMPLSEKGNDDWKPAPTKIDPSVDMKNPPKEQVDGMSGGQFFSYAAELLKLHPPHFTDEPIIARMKRIGIEPGKSFDVASVDPAIRKGIEAAPKAAQDLMAWKLPKLAQVVNYWSLNTDTMGVYGNYYLKRALITQQGLGANVPEDAVYPLNLGDKDGKPLDGTNNYTIHFDKDDIPPVDAFWSITLYDPNGSRSGTCSTGLPCWMPCSCTTTTPARPCTSRARAPERTRKRTGSPHRRVRST